jgi:hypothetical protein
VRHEWGRREIHATFWCKNLKESGSRPDEMNEIFNLPNPSGRTRPRDYSVSNINEYQKQKKKFLGSRARPVRRTDICKPIV